MAFPLTYERILSRTKTETCRDATTWECLKAGDEIDAIKERTVRKGERLRILARLKIEQIRVKKLRELAQDDVDKLGFPSFSPEEYAMFFCGTGKRGSGNSQAGKRSLDSEVRLIEFTYL